MQHHQQQRRSLLCVAGLSPQVITETIWALWQRDGVAHLPEQIHIITTNKGQERIEANLIDPAGPSYLHRLYLDIQNAHPEKTVPQPELHIHLVATDSGISLDDINDQASNDAAADTICNVVRHLCRNAELALHGSIAGGRKTMGFYLGYAMSLYARRGDELSHVLVNSPFESHHDFYYPPMIAQMIEWNDGRSIQRINTSKAVIMLAPIAFVRLRDRLPDNLNQPDISFSKVVELAQRSLDPPRLQVDLPNRQIYCNGQPVQLSNVELTLMAWMAERIKSGLGGVFRYQFHEHSDDLLRWRRYLTGTNSSSVEKLEQQIKHGGLTINDFDYQKSRLNKTLERQLGSELANHFKLQQLGKRNSPFGLTLQPDQIELNDPSRWCAL